MTALQNHTQPGAPVFVLALLVISAACLAGEEQVLAPDHLGRLGHAVAGRCGDAVLSPYAPIPSGHEEAPDSGEGPVLLRDRLWFPNPYSSPALFVVVREASNFELVITDGETGQGDRFAFAEIPEGLYVLGFTRRVTPRTPCTVELLQAGRPVGSLDVGLDFHCFAWHENLVGNGDCEARDEGKNEPLVWRATRVPHTRDQVDFAWDDEVFHTGNRSLAISLADDHPEDQIHYNWNQHLSRFRPGGSYRVSAWVRGRNLTSSAFLAVQCWNREMTEVLGSVSNGDDQQVTGTTDWTRVTLSLEVPAGTGRMVVLAGIAAPANRGGTVWFDDLSIVPEGGR